MKPRIQFVPNMALLAVLMSLGTVEVVRAQSCTILDLQYREALAEARVCSALSGERQCTWRVPQDLTPCGRCPTYVNPANTFAVARMDSLYREWRSRGCGDDTGCGASVCTEVFGAVCDAPGRCQDVFEPVGVAPEDSRAGGLALGPGRPNPFGSATRIPFVIDRRDRVMLAIYNVAGQRLRTLVDRVMDPGSYSQEWDGRDAGGRLVGSGVYYVRLAVGNRAYMRRGVVVR